MFRNLSSPNPPEYPPASLLLRSIAYLLDMALLLLLTWGLLGLIYPAGMEVFVSYSQNLQGSNNIDNINQGLEQLAKDNPEFQKLLLASQPLSFLVLLFYFMLCETLLGGATLGKKTFNLRTAYRDSPRIPPLGQLFIRSTIKSLASLSIGHPIMFLLSGNFLIAFFLRDRKCIHDYLTHTSVVPGFLPDPTVGREGTK